MTSSLRKKVNTETNWVVLQKYDMIKIGRLNIT